MPGKKLNLASYSIDYVIVVMSLVFFLLFLGPLNVLPQDYLDSLKMELGKTTGDEKIGILQKICKEYMFKSHDSCIAYGKETIMLS